MAITTLLVDDNALFRDGIAQILLSDGRFDVVGQASSGAEGVAAAGRLQPDLVMMDLQMPGMSGVDAIRSIAAGNPTVPIAVLTMSEPTAYVRSALRLEHSNSGLAAHLREPSVLLLRRPPRGYAR